MPALYPVIFMCFLVVFEGVDGDGIEIVKVAIGGVVDCARFEVFGFFGGRRGCGEG